MTTGTTFPPQTEQPVVTVPRDPATAEVLTPAALAFLGRLHEQFEPARQALLARRRERQARLDAGELPDFLPHTRELRQAAWTAAPIPHDLRRRHVEITGPVDR